MEEKKTYRIKEGFGYWDTTYYPVGGDFKRALAGGIQVQVTRTFPLTYGANTEGETPEGKTIAFDRFQAEEE